MHCVNPLLLALQKQKPPSFRHLGDGTGVSLSTGLGMRGFTASSSTAAPESFGLNRPRSKSNNVVVDSSVPLQDEVGSETQNPSANTSYYPTG